jgi:hypothetical protein
MFTPRFDEKAFLENLLLDESRDAYQSMSPAQRAVVHKAYLCGHAKCLHFVKTQSGGKIGSMTWVEAAPKPV